MRPSLNLLMLFCLTFFSCSTNNAKQESKTDAQTSSVDTMQQVDTSQKHVETKLLADTDTLTIDTKAAVFFQPDSLQMENRMKEAGEENFRAGADDYIYYINTSAEYLEKQGLPVIAAKNKKFLKFIMADKKMQLIKLDTLEDLWGMYMFDPKNKPHYADIIEIEEDYKNYFK